MLKDIFCNYPLWLSIAPKEYFDDEEFIFKVLSNNGLAIVYCPDYVKKNKVYATVAISSNPLAYKYLDNELKKDKELIMLTLDNLDFKLNFNEKTQNDLICYNDYKVLKQTLTKNN